MWKPGTWPTLSPPQLMTWVAWSVPPPLPSPPQLYAPSAAVPTMRASTIHPNRSSEILTLALSGADQKQDPGVPRQTPWKAFQWPNWEVNLGGSRAGALTPIRGAWCKAHLAETVRRCWAWLGQGCLVPVTYLGATSSAIKNCVCKCCHLWSTSWFVRKKDCCLDGCLVAFLLLSW